MEIKYFKEWPKLKKPVHTTVRLSTIAKAEYYRSKIGHTFQEVVNGKPLQKVRLIQVFEPQLYELEDNFTKFDAELSKSDFYKLMEKLYSKKPEWIGKSTYVLVLLLEAIR